MQYPLKKTITLSVALARAHFKLRNEGTYLGIAWYLLNPLLLFAILFFVFSDRLGSAIPHYPAYLFLGIIMFNYFAQTTQESTRILSDHGELIRSIKFPTESLVVGVALRNILSHVAELILFGILLFAIDLPLFLFLGYIPVFGLLFLFSLGAGFFLSAVSSQFTDISNAWSFVTRILWIGTPLFYEIEGQNLLHIASLFNPLYYFITLARDIVVYHQLPSLGLIGISLLFSASSLVIGMGMFMLLKKRFAEQF